MPKIKLTHRGIDSLAAGKWRVDYWDEGLPGFGVRAHHNGRKSFFVRYKVASTKRRLTLGKHPTMSLAQARSKAKELLGRVAKGEDPQAEKWAQKKAETFGDTPSRPLSRARFSTMGLETQHLISTEKHSGASQWLKS